MKKTLSIFSALLALTASATVQADESVYVGFLGGANWMNLTSQHHNHNRGRVDLSTGYLLGGSLGFEWCEGISLEAEIAYRHNNVHRFKFKEHSHRHGRHVHGDVHTTSYLANAYYSIPFDECCDFAIKPYLGVGIGYANGKARFRGFNRNHHKDFSGSISFNDSSSSDHISIHVDDSSSADESSSESIIVVESPSSVSSEPHRRRRHHKDHGSKTHNGFAYQFIAGVAYELTCELDLGVEYRYFHTSHSSNNDLVVNLKYGF